MKGNSNLAEDRTCRLGWTDTENPPLFHTEFLECHHLVPQNHSTVHKPSADCIYATPCKNQGPRSHLRPVWGQLLWEDLEMYPQVLSLVAQATRQSFDNEENNLQISYPMHWLWQADVRLIHYIYISLTYNYIYYIIICTWKLYTIYYSIYIYFYCISIYTLTILSIDIMRNIFPPPNIGTINLAVVS